MLLTRVPPPPPPPPPLEYVNLRHHMFRGDLSLRLNGLDPKQNRADVEWDHPPPDFMLSCPRIPVALCIHNLYSDYVYPKVTEEFIDWTKTIDDREEQVYLARLARQARELEKQKLARLARQARELEKQDELDELARIAFEKQDELARIAFLRELEKQDELARIAQARQARDTREKRLKNLKARFTRLPPLPAASIAAVGGARGCTSRPSRPRDQRRKLPGPATPATRTNGSPSGDHLP
jgi:hypothetical protein